MTKSLLVGPSYGGELILDFAQSIQHRLQRLFRELHIDCLYPRDLVLPSGHVLYLAQQNENE